MKDNFLVDPLGDGRAEHDHAMLDHAFYEWSDYKAIAENHGRYVIVGRRGTGKSALAYKLNSLWRSERKFCIEISPTEEELIGFRSVATVLGTRFSHIRAGIKILWKYALALQLLSELEKYYKTSSRIKSDSTLRQHLSKWNNSSGGIFSKIRRTQLDWMKAQSSPEVIIGDLAEHLQLSTILQSLKDILETSSKTAVILIDRLDEGWTPDEIGIGVTDGLVHGTGELRDKLEGSVLAYIFLRDNIYRSIQRFDTDFSRNIEPKVLRLHWHPQELLYLTTSRIRHAFHIDKESSIKIWNAFTENELHGISGFKGILKNTLYRPRDVIALLNNALYIAQKQSRNTITKTDISSAAETISRSRLDDLGKEYGSVFPGLELILSKFDNHNVRLSAGDVQNIFLSLQDNTEIAPNQRQHLTILSQGFEGVAALHSVGFLGIKNEVSKNFVFCHDGKQPVQTISRDTELIVHPCYWPALGLSEITDNENFAEEIFDEYEVTIYSTDADQRSQIIGRTISELNDIPLGNEGASQFEEWCKQAINYCFSTQLTNVALHPNKSAVQRRDVVATNLGKGGVWRRIIEDYRSRQVIFEVKNYEDLSISEFRQVHAYLGKEYGKLGFIVCRAKKIELSSAESAAFREFYKSESGHLIVKLTASWLVSALSKLRSPQKHDHADSSLSNRLDEYIRVYANEQLTRKPRRTKKS